jgi:hypothetical protein
MLAESWVEVSEPLAESNSIGHPSTYTPATHV